MPEAESRDGASQKSLTINSAQVAEGHERAVRKSLFSLESPADGSADMSARREGGCRYVGRLF